METDMDEKKNRIEMLTLAELRARAAAVQLTDEYKSAKRKLMALETTHLHQACRGIPVSRAEADYVLALRRLVAMRYDPIERCWKDLEAN
jgi:hypothetical protein